MGNGRANQYGVKMLFSKKVSSTFSPPSPVIRQSSRRNELPTAHQQLVAPQLQPLE